jgi:UDP-N-acetylglucosamine 1-carboxyvinyltransferase
MTKYTASYTLSLNEQLGRNLKARREGRKVSQAELAKRAGTSQATIARLETGQANATFELTQRVWSALGYDVVLQFRPRQQQP